MNSQFRHCSLCVSMCVYACVSCVWRPAAPTGAGLGAGGSAVPAVSVSLWGSAGAGARPEVPSVGRGAAGRGALEPAVALFSHPAAGCTRTLRPARRTCTVPHGPWAPAQSRGRRSAVPPAARPAQPVAAQRVRWPPLASDGGANIAGTPHGDTAVICRRFHMFTEARRKRVSVHGWSYRT